ncbi:hypothetical protein JW777_00355 [bacterium]|nr:hypothetical protein [bacterium]
MNPKANRPLQSQRRPGPKSRGGQITLILILDAAFILLHLWGRVQIDFAVRANQKLSARCQRLQADVDDLSARNEKLRSYERISGLAKLMGLESVSSDRLEHLPVDLRGLDRPDPSAGSGVALAGMAFFGSRPNSQEPKGKRSGGANVR